MISNDLKLWLCIQDGQYVAKAFHERRKHIVVNISLYKQHRTVGDKHHAKALIGAADHRF